ncbi:MAG: hypothetical protein IPN01_12890, partial [Deltaproteobacteria bacterium]|nr:hypothetical protein [Deltaproteobacteria bacterium]
FVRVIVVLDADTWSSDQITQELEQLRARRDALLEPDSRFRLEFVFAVPTIEAWVLGAVAPDKFTELSGRSSGADLKRALQEVAPGWQRRLTELDLDFDRARGFIDGLDHLIDLLLMTSS